MGVGRSGGESKKNHKKGEKLVRRNLHLSSDEERPGRKDGGEWRKGTTMPERMRSSLY